jgi:copper(I)-binding protein
MNRYLRPLVAALALGACTSALAQVAVMDPWVRGVVPAQKATGAFMQLKSATDVTLVGVASPVAGVVEVHEMRMDGNVMKMGAIPKLDLPAGKIVELKPGGYHIMLMDLKQPLKDGERVPVTLTLQDKSGARFNVDVQATVRPLAAPATTTHKH